MMLEVPNTAHGTWLIVPMDAFEHLFPYSMASLTL